MQNNTHTSAALKKVVTWARALYIPESIIPSDMLELENLETLNLYDLKLTTLPDELSALSNLKKLYLASNSFSELPLVVCKLEKLEALWIMNNSIVVLPKEILNLCNLKELVAFDNNITTIPNLLQMKMLDYLVLSYNKLSQEQTTALQKEFAGKSNLTNQKTDMKFRIEPLTSETLKEAKQLRDKVFVDIPKVELLTLDAAISREQYKEVYEKNVINFMKYWVAKNKDDAVIGLVGIYTEPEDDENSCWLGWFCVNDDYRGLGYGKKLLEYAEMEVTLLGMNYLHLYTENVKECKSAVKLYKKEGFIEYETSKKQSKHEIYFKKILSNEKDSKHYHMNKQEIELIISKISKKINLTKAGDNYKCRCPFHTEIGNLDGSLVINTDKNLYHCFGCGKGDTILSFLEEISREGDLND